MADPSFTPGYPIDARPIERVTRLNRGPVGDFELSAARVVARFTGARVTLQDDGSQPSMVDIRIDDLDRPSGFVEVWTDLEGRYAATYSRLMGQDQRIPRELPVLDGMREWFVTVDKTSDLRTLESEIGSHLIGLELAGKTFEIVAERKTLAEQADRYLSRLLELGVVSLSSKPAEGGAGIARLYLRGVAGPSLPDWSSLLTWLNSTLESDRVADVRAKLAGTRVAERHVFIGLTFTSPGEAYFALSQWHSTLPHLPPQLPTEITHVWLMNTPPLGRCIAWFPDRGWFDVARHWKTS